MFFWGFEWGVEVGGGALGGVELGLFFGLFVSDHGSEDGEDEGRDFFDPVVQREEIEYPELINPEPLTPDPLVHEREIEQVIWREAVSEVPDNKGTVVFLAPWGDLIWNEKVEESVLIDPDVLCAQFE